MTGTRQTIQYSLALEPAHQGETRVSGYQGAEPVVASQHPKARLCKPNPVEPPWYVTRMPGGVEGVAPRGVPLSRSIVLYQSRNYLVVIERITISLGFTT